VQFGWAVFWLSLGGFLVCEAGGLVLTQGYACGLSYLICICLRHYSLGWFLCLGVVFKGFFFEPVFVWQPISPCMFFFSPELISASCTGLLVNNILPIQKKKKKR
jgi:hypothetical protein